MELLKTRFTKISADGAVLPAEATQWAAVLDGAMVPGLMWTTAHIAVKNHKGCAAALKKLQGTAGFSDWRLPSVEELFLLADRTRNSPAIDTDFFPDCPSDWFWSSTEYQPSPGGFAWLVGFSVGIADWYGRNGVGWVRAVRVGQ